jgi:hypothetical protein
MTERNHWRDLPIRCDSHPPAYDRLQNSKGTPNVYYCPNRGIAHTVSGGAFLRPSRFEAVYNTATLNPTLLKNMILRQGVHRPRSLELVNIPLRKEAVRELHRLSVEEKLQHSTFVRSVALLDQLLSSTPLDILDYKIVLRTTLNLASKLCESDGKSLTVSQLAHKFRGEYHKETIAKWEVNIYSALGWTLNVVTAHDFANFFLWQGVATEREMEHLAQGRDTDAKDLMNCLEVLVTFILDVTLMEFGFYRFTPSGLAASAVATARETLGLFRWTSELKEITDMDLEKHERCLNSLAELLKVSGAGVALNNIVRRYFAGEVRLNQVPRPETPVPVEENTSSYAPTGTVWDSPLSNYRSPFPEALLVLEVAVVSTPSPNTPFRHRQPHPPTPQMAGLPSLSKAQASLGKTGPRTNRIRKMRH